MTATKVVVLKDN